MKLTLLLAVLVGSVVIAASILFIGRWQISGVAYGYGYANGTSQEADPAPRDISDEGIFRLDRWTGEIDYCTLKPRSADPTEVQDRLAKTGAVAIKCD
jgi:hypothetical protein